MTIQGTNAKIGSAGEAGQPRYSLFVQWATYGLSPYELRDVLQGGFPYNVLLKPVNPVFHDTAVGITGSTTVRVGVRMIQGTNVVEELGHKNLFGFVAQTNTTGGSFLGFQVAELGQFTGDLIEVGVGDGGHLVRNFAGRLIVPIIVQGEMHQNVYLVAYAVGKHGLQHFLQ